MAKKHTQIIEFDIITKGMDTAEKSLSGMVDNTGDLGKKAKDVLKDIGKARDIMEEYGEEIPISKAKELYKILQRIATNSEAISEMDTIQIFGPKEQEKLKKINAQITEYNKKIKAQIDLEQEAAKKRNDRIEQLKGQKTATLTDDKGGKKSVKLDSIKDKWKDKGDLEKIRDSKSSSNEEREAAIAVLQQLTKAEEDYAKTVQESQEKQKNYNAKIAELKNEKATLATTTRETTEEEKTAGESVQK
jgi:chromosome segregation ATPase